MVSGADDVVGGAATLEIIDEVSPAPSVGKVVGPEPIKVGAVATATVAPDPTKAVLTSDAAAELTPVPSIGKVVGPDPVKATVAPDPLKAGATAELTPAPTPIKAATTAELATPAPTPGKLATAGAAISFITKVVSVIGVIATVAPKLKELMESIKGDCENENAKKQTSKKSEKQQTVPKLSMEDKMKGRA